MEIQIRFIQGWHSITLDDIEHAIHYYRTHKGIRFDALILHLMLAGF